MVKRPPDLNPEDFILGKGWYTQRRAAAPFADAGQFRIDPASIPAFPWLSMLLLNSLYVLFFGAFIWFLQSHHDPDVSMWMVNLSFSGICLMTCGGTIGFVMFERLLGARDKAMGPWLVYDKSTRRVRLPRLHLDFERAEVVHLQYISTDFLQNSRSLLSNTKAVSELNLVTVREGKPQRWNLLNSSFPFDAFEYLLDPLVEQTDIPVVRITETAGNWKVWTRPYHDPMNPARV
jgi:hypothetical protein